MERKHIITLSGKPGSGKSSTADKVAELLSYTRYSAGDIVRNLLRKHNLSLDEFNRRAQTDHEIDYMIDEELRNLRTQKDIVVDSRLGFYWIPESFKVYLDLDDDIAMARIFKDITENASRVAEGGSTSSLQEVQQQVRDRMNNERKRFVAMYGTDPFKTANFDLVINTSRHSPQTVALTVFDYYQKWLKSAVWEQVVSEVPLGYSYKNDY